MRKVPNMCSGKAQQIREHCSLEVSAVDQAKKEVLSLTMDSGAAESVTNKQIAKEHAVVQTAGPERDAKYILPSGEVIENQGEKHIKVNMKEGSKCVLRMQATDMRKSLMSVGNVRDEGHRVVFEALGGYIEHLESGQRTHFDRRGGVYILDVEIEPQKVFSRHGM